MDELFDQTKEVFVLGPTDRQEVPQADRLQRHPRHRLFMDDGYTDEEHKMWNETHKILDPDHQADGDLRARAGVRRPLRSGATSSSSSRSTADEAREILREAPGVIVIDKHDRTGYITPKEAQGEFAVYRHPHPQGPDRRERPGAVGGVGQPAQGRGAQRRADRRMPDQPQADQREEKGGVASNVRRQRAQ